MDRRTLLTMALCFLVFFGWQKFYIEPRTPRARPGNTQTAPGGQPTAGAATSGGQASALAVTAQPGQSSPAVEAKVESLAFEGAKLSLSNGAAAFSDWTLSQYPEINLESVTHQTDGEVTLAFDSPELAHLASTHAPLVASTDGKTYSWDYEDARVKISRKLRFLTNSSAEMRYQADFKTDLKPKYAFVSISAQAKSNDPDIRDRQVVYWDGSSINREAIKESMSLKDIPAPVKWIGTSSRYFLLALMNDQETVSKGLIFPKGPFQAQASLVYPITGNSISIPLKIYFGPKEIGTLQAVEPTLDHTIDFGWFSVLALPMLQIMKKFHEWVGNWGIAIILLTLLVRLAVFPLMYKSAKGMKQMAKIQPQIQKLREKHKENPQVLNQEMLSLMKTQGYNPMSGCLPLFVQMPVFFALYRVLYSSIELYQAPFGFWIHDLALKDPFYVTPILLTSVMFLQQRLTPNTVSDPVQAKMFQWMPVIFGVFMISLPAGLTLYMLTNALVGIFQQMYLNKKLELRPRVATP